MKKYIFITFLFVNTIVLAQTALKNNGNLQLHNNAKIGFHTNLINEGSIVNNLGFAGFYGKNETLTVSGSNSPVFYNVEIDAQYNLELEVSLGVTNELTFFEGKVITPRDNTNISLNFIRHNWYIGEDDQHYVDGYALVKNYAEEFSFPIGDANRLRPMILPPQTGNNTFKGAYFFEDPNSPSNFSSFNTSDKQNLLSNISNLEFWDLDGTTPTNITLTWNNQSAIALLAENINNLRVVGWNKTTNQWENLGNTFVDGNSNEGKITSTSFIPNNYEVITIGSVNENGTATNNNYLISPNEDGLNDSFVLEEVTQYTKNKLSIYNRWGNLVFRTENYKNDWKGLSNGRSVLMEKEGLPVGTYYYLFEYGNNKLDHKKQGWVYINR